MAFPLSGSTSYSFKPKFAMVRPFAPSSRLAKHCWCWQLLGFFQQAAGRETCCPAQLFQGRFLQSRLRPIGRAWWRREGSLLVLALPLEDGKPFPLEALFCLGRVEQVEGRRCIVYTFREEEPLSP